MGNGYMHRRNNPVIYTQKRCTQPVVVTDNNLFGFFTFDKIPIGRNQESLKWNTIGYVSGLEYYSTNETFGIGIIKGMSQMYSLADISFEEVFELADLEDSPVYVSKVSVEQSGRVIVATLVCHYGEYVILSSVSINIESILLSSTAYLSHPSDEFIQTDTELRIEEYHGSYGFSVSSRTQTEASREDLNKIAIQHHIAAMNTHSDYEIVSFDIEDFDTIQLGEEIFVISVGNDRIEISNVADASYDGFSERTRSISGFDTKDNFIGTLIRSIPRCSKVFNESYYSYKIPNGIARRFKDFNRILIQRFEEEQLRSYKIDIYIDESTQKYIFSSEIDSSTGKMVPEILKDASKDEAQFTYFSKNLMYNTDGYLFKYLDSVLESGIDGMIDADSKINSVSSVSHFIEYS